MFETCWASSCARKTTSLAVMTTNTMALSTVEITFKILRPCYVGIIQNHLRCLCYFQAHDFSYIQYVAHKALGFACLKTWYSNHLYNVQHKLKKLIPWYSLEKSATITLATSFVHYWIYLCFHHFDYLCKLDYFCAWCTAVI